MTNGTTRLVDDRHGRIGPINMTGPIGWTFPAGLIALIGTVIVVAAFVAYGLTGSFPLCADERGLMLSFVTPAVAAGACIAVSAFESALTRAAASIGGAIVLGGLTWLIVHRIFAMHC